MRHHYTRRGARVAALAVSALLAAACRDSGDAKDEAPAQNAGAPAETQSAGEVTANTAPGGMLGASVEHDTTALPGVSGSATAGVGNSSGSVGTPGAGPLRGGSPSDAAVRSVLGAVNAAEVDVSQLALQKAQNAEVRRYAQDMLDAHRRDAARPANPAQHEAADLLVPFHEMHQKALAQLRAAPAGQGFDRAFMTAQVQAHQAALQTLARLATAAREPALTERIRTMQGDVERHLERALQIQNAVGGAS